MVIFKKKTEENNSASFYSVEIQMVLHKYITRSTQVWGLY